MIQGKTVRSLIAVLVTAATIMAVSTSAQADRKDDKRVVGAIVGSVIGAAIGSTIGRGRDRTVAIGIGSLLGGVAGYHAVDPHPRRHHRRGRHHARHGRHTQYLLPAPHVHVRPWRPPRHRHAHHHHHPPSPRPKTVVRYMLPAPVTPTVTPIVPVREANIVSAPLYRRSYPRHGAALAECKLIDPGIAPVYACRTVEGDWRLLK